MSETAPSPSPRRRFALRLLLAVAFATVGFVAVWQGFGLAGFGTDIHIRRVFIAVALLFAAGMSLGWPKMRPVGRVLAALVGLGAAGAAWWYVPSSSFKSAMSLREAVEMQDRYRGLIDTATVDDVERYEGLRGISVLLDQYPSLTRETSIAYGQWKDWMQFEIEVRYNQTPPDDPKTVLALCEASQRLAEGDPATDESLKKTHRRWVTAAVHAKRIELTAALHDWEAFDRTAPGRQAIAEALPEARPELVAIEEEWVEIAALGSARFHDTRAKGGKPPQVDWCAIEKTVLGLKSVDTGNGRFMQVRRGLFDFAHDGVKWQVATHLEAGRYNAAFGVARKHAVEWNATATLLGAEEVKKLDALREKCAALVKPDSLDPSPVEETEIAPPPRTKPEK